MTDAFNLLASGQYIMAVFTPYINLLGLQVFMFLGLMMVLILLYVKTEVITISWIVGLILISGIGLSGLFSGLGGQNPIVPPVFEAWLYVVVIGALAWMLFAAWFRR